MEDFWLMFDNYDKEIELNIGDPFREDVCTGEDIESCLAQMQYDHCYLSLKYLTEEGNHRLDIDSENGSYYMIYFDEEGMYYNYSNPNRSQKKEVEFGGEDIPDYMICDDFNDVKEIFRQFLDEDRVSEELMD